MAHRHEHAARSAAWAAVCSRAQSSYHGAPVVAVAGAGPVGLTMALSLAAKGVHAEVFEAADQPTTHPQAHFIHHSSVEILGNLGLLPAILEAAPPVDEWHKFVYCRSLTETPLAVNNHLTRSAAAHLTSVSPVSAVHLAQSRLVQILLDAAHQHPLVTLRFGARVRRL